MSHLSSSLSVIGTDIDCSAAHDFLLVFYSNYGPISYHFRDNGRYLQNFPTPIWGGFCLEVCHGSGPKNL